MGVLLERLDATSGSGNNHKKNIKDKNIITINELEEFKNRKSSKKVYDKMELKRIYLNRIVKEQGANSAKNVFYTFSRCSGKEIREGRDLCLFNEDQLSEMLTEIGYTSLSAITSDISNLVGYIDFCNERGVIAIKYNLLREMPAFRFENLKNFLNIYKSIDNYFSEIRIKSYINSMVNAMDQALIVLLAEGIKGKELCEIINLKKSDVNWKTGELTLRNENGDIIRKKIVSKDTIEILRASSKQDVFYSKNGKYREIRTGRQSQAVIDGEYVIRATGYREKKGDKIAIMDFEAKGTQAQPTTKCYSKTTRIALEARMRQLKEELDIRKFTATNIFESAIINKTIEKMRRDDINIDDRQEVLLAIYEALEWAGVHSKSKAHTIREKIDVIAYFKDEFKGTPAIEEYGLQE